MAAGWNATTTDRENWRREYRNGARGNVYLTASRTWWRWDLWTDDGRENGAAETLTDARRDCDAAARALKR